MNYPILVWWLALAVCVPSVVSSTVTSPETNAGDYGITWIFVPDENGNPQVLYLDESYASGDTRNEPLEIQVALYDRDDPFRGRDGRTEIMYYRETSFHNEALTAQAMLRFNAALDTKMVAHGWMSSSKEQVVKLILDAYAKRELNFFGIDWKVQASKLWYLSSALRVADVGLAVGELIDLLVRKKKADSKRIHLIGHSLGAHVMGNAGYYFNSIDKKTVGRITGLDPAGPGFEYRKALHFTELRKHLEKTDADFVDVIHTDVGGWGGSRSMFTDLGFHDPIGHVDFYPNGKTMSQEGCGFFSPTHSRAYEYYAESINSKNGFFSVPCFDVATAHRGECSGDPIRMGDPVPTKARGIYYLTTNPRAPFAKGVQTVSP